MSQMAQTTVVPQDATHRKCDQTTIAVSKICKTLKCPATAVDIFEAMQERAPTSVSVRTVRRCLWVLFELGVVTCEERDDVRYWRIAAGGSQ